MTTPRRSAPPLLDVRDLRTWFHGPDGPARAVDGVSFGIGAGESVGLVGESGCGKTVLCLSLLGLVPAPGRIETGSSVRLDGEEFVGADGDELRRARGGRVGMVFQEPSSALNPVLRVGDQVAEVVRVHTGLPRRAARDRAVALLAEVGMDDPADAARAWPHQLSGGMKQRAVVAGALAGEPELLVADEPTTALDVTVQAKILELLRTLRERRGMALLLVSHDLAVVAEVCERVLVMYAGEIVERGPVRDLFQRPLHPYTGALLEAAAPPVIRDDRGRRRRLRTIPGVVPSALSWPPACRFAPRCPRAWDRCREAHPPRLAPGGVDPRAATRDARCWLVETSSGGEEGP